MMNYPVNDLHLKDVSKLVYLDIEHSGEKDSELYELYDADGHVTIGDVVDYYRAKGRFEGITEGIDHLREKYSEEEFNKWMQFLDEIDNNGEYRNWKIKNVVSNNLNEESGFVAFTIDTGDAHIVAFRGSEEISDPEYRNDWYNNFRTTYEINDQQNDVREYIRQYLKPEEIDQLYITGHSLGGNLALFASFNLPEQLREKLVTVTTFNAPGFNRGVLNKYADVIEKLDTLGKIREYQNTHDPVPALLYNPTKGILIETAIDSKNPFDHHALEAFKIENGQLVVAAQQTRLPHIRMIHYLTTGFEAYPEPVKEMSVNGIFKIWNGRWDFYDVAAFVALAVPMASAPIITIRLIIGAAGHLLAVGFFMSEILPRLREGWNALIERLTAFKNQMVQWVKEFVMQVGEFIGLVGQELLAFKDRAARAIADFIERSQQLIQNFIQFMREQIDKVVKWWNDLTDRVAQTAKKLADKTKAFIRTTTEKIKTGVRELKDATVEFAVELKDTAIQKAKEAFVFSLKTGISLAYRLQQAKTKVKEWTVRAGEWLREATVSAINEIRKEARKGLKMMRKIRDTLILYGRYRLTRRTEHFYDFVRGTTHLFYGDRIAANLERMNHAQQQIRRRQEDIETQVERLLSQVERIVRDTGNRYPEWYVRSLVHEVEALCGQLRRENREWNEQLRKLTDGIKFSVGKYRETERKILSMTRTSFA